MSQIGTKYLTLIHSTSMRLNLADTNECIEGTSNCSADAVCNNTKGSYNCACKQGYNRDGNICRLGIISTAVFLKLGFVLFLSV